MGDADEEDLHPPFAVVVVVWVVDTSNLTPIFSHYLAFSARHPSPNWVEWVQIQ